MLHHDSLAVLGKLLPACSDSLNPSEIEMQNEPRESRLKRLRVKFNRRSRTSQPALRQSISAERANADTVIMIIHDSSTDMTKRLQS